MGSRNAYAVVTGASSGIGAEFAKRLAKEGFDLILVARRKARLHALGEQIAKERCGQVTYHIIEADLSDMDECEALCKKIADKKIAVFINNAGFGDCGYFLDGDMKKQLNMIDVNIKAVHYLTKCMLHKMQVQGGGYILNVGSSAGLMPAGPYMATYYATKAYVTSMTRAIAEELRERNSRIYIGCLCPGPVNTEFNDVANVEFALAGISAEYCANYAIDQMMKRKIVIVPTFTMKAAMTFGRFLPQDVYIRIAAHQQKKKLSVKK